jgi:hypothetical protein
MASTGKSELIPGIPARNWYVIAFASLGGFFLYLILMAIVYSTDAQAVQAPKHPVAAFLFVAGLFVFIVAILVAQVKASRKTREEFAAGYTTLPYISGDRDLRDPRDGRLLRKENTGYANTTFTLSMKRSRQYADEVDRGMWR